MHTFTIATAICPLLSVVISLLTESLLFSSVFIVVCFEEEFNVPENTSVAAFFEFLCKCYPQLGEQKEMLDEIQLETKDSLENVDLDSTSILLDGNRLIFMD